MTLDKFDKANIYNELKSLQFHRKINKVDSPTLFKIIDEIEMENA